MDAGVNHNQQLLTPGDRIDLSNCDLEPIHIPSSIQAHGLVVAARSTDLQILYVSENSTEFLGLSPKCILEQTLTELLGEQVMESIEAALGQEQHAPQYIAASSLPISGNKRFDVVAHRIDGLLCVELELALEERRWDLLSTRLGRAMRELGHPKTIECLCSAVAPLIRNLTGYDRVMVYRFDPDGHGEVIGEDKASDMEPFLGLHYPASDIPRQARELYLLQRIRMITDIGYTPVRVLGKRAVIQDEPLDMTFCGLRSVSPIHIEYLQNMGVGASLGISLILNDDLWGMIVCHHRTKRQIPHETRALCDILGQVLSLLIAEVQKNQESSARLANRALLEVLSRAIEGQESIGAALTEIADIFLSLVGADGAFIRIGNQTHSIGETPALSTISSLMSALQAARVGDVWRSDELGKDFPAFSHIARLASGVLMLSLSGVNDGILWFRGEFAQTVLWAGDPRVPKHSEESFTRLSPRKSFAAWQRVQRGRAIPWSPRDIDSCKELQQIVVKALLRSAESKLEISVSEDPLTGLFNRRMLLEYLADWKDRVGQRTATLLFLDLDNFTRVNDQLGYQAGDELLRQIGRRLTSLTDGKHFIARLGGDEFAIFCENLDLLESEKLANSIIHSLPQPLFVENGIWSVTASIGIATVPPNELLGGAITDPLRIADSAMYVAKHKGGDQVSIVEGKQHAKVLQIRIDEALAERQLTSDELADAYLQLNSVMDSTSHGILQISHDWIVLYGNRKATELLRNFNVGIECRICFPALCSELAEQYLRKVMNDHSEATFEVNDLVSSRWYELNAYPNGSGLTIFFNDISDMKMMRDQLSLEQLLREKRIEALSHMAGTLAHEISNPLAIIHGKASDLGMLASGSEPLDSIKVRDTCNAIVKTANQASSILRGLRGFAREGDQDEMELASIYVIVGECVEAQSARFQRHSVELHVALSAGIPLFDCREVQIGQILTNLLNNAFDEITNSNPAERWITLTAEARGDNLHLEVTDSGPGIEDRFKAHLMEPFFTTKSFGHGMGVGLSLSRAIAHDHGGTLTLLEGKPHTCFCLMIPFHCRSASRIENTIALEVPYEAA
jgi:diguanylate cyclase (GGDEF)-like protein